MDVAKLDARLANKEWIGKKAPRFCVAVRAETGRGRSLATIKHAQCGIMNAHCVETRHGSALAGAPPSGEAWRADNNRSR
jgi:hypothetical protein